MSSRKNLPIVHLVQSAKRKEARIFLASTGMVLRKGLEPLRLTAHAPQTCVSTNSTT